MLILTLEISVSQQQHSTFILQAVQPNRNKCNGVPFLIIQCNYNEVGIHYHGHYE